MPPVDEEQQRKLKELEDFNRPLTFKPGPKTVQRFMWCVRAMVYFQIIPEPKHKLAFQFLVDSAYDELKRRCDLEEQALKTEMAKPEVKVQHA